MISGPMLFGGSSKRRRGVREKACVSGPPWAPNLDNCPRETHEPSRPDRRDARLVQWAIHTGTERPRNLEDIPVAWLPTLIHSTHNGQALSMGSAAALVPSNFRIIDNW
ncbi:hypothetical protein CENSYa_1833 [Cenarchaeum symbiosum A]|uniref:Uncharacterized protein n=1 Tax=Cenarchaeum symbiosum (strain A) TaxID=414004 RepID=A0RYM6_CENSY|nr:hypothetical protein CENSYa_1833 [Cenarchaeum symbiosum A]